MDAGQILLECGGENSPLTAFLQGILCPRQPPIAAQLHKHGAHHGQKLVRETTRLRFVPQIELDQLLRRQLPIGRVVKCVEQLLLRALDIARQFLQQPLQNSRQWSSQAIQRRRQERVWSHHVVVQPGYGVERIAEEINRLGRLLDPTDEGDVFTIQLETDPLDHQLGHPGGLVLQFAEHIVQSGGVPQGLQQFTPQPHHPQVVGELGGLPQLPRLLLQ